VPDTPPDLRGTHVGWWNRRDHFGDNAGGSGGFSCWATIEITEQTGERIMGRYETDAECHESAGTLEGSVNVNSWLEFTVTTDEGTLDPLGADAHAGCVLLDQEPTYAGSVIGGFLVRRTFTLKCGERPLFQTSGFREILPAPGPRR